jgi:hypothetical protein
MSRPELWELAGARTFVRKIAADLVDGRSLILALPDGVSISELKSRIRKAVADADLAWESRGVAQLETLAKSPGRALVTAFGLLPAESSMTDAALVAQASRLARVVIWIDGLDGDADAACCVQWWAFLRAYAQAARLRHAGDRAVFCVPASGASALTMAELEDDVLLARRWWWGVLSRHDLWQLVAESFDDGDSLGSAVASAMAIEVGGFDPEVVLFLRGSAQWDSGRWIDEVSRFDPAERLKRLAGDVARIAEELRRAGDPRSPSAALRVAWAAGGVDRVRGVGPMLHACLLAASGRHGDLEHRAWRGQVGLILPWIDERRLEICRRLNGNSRGRPRGQPPTDYFALEIGDLKRRFDVDRAFSREPSALKQLVRWLHRARNEVAHVRRLALSEIASGLNLLRQLQELDGA